MLAGRGLKGAAFAILAVAGTALATANAAAEHRALVIGLVSAWVPIGQLLAALLGPFALETGGWQSLWVASLLLAVLLTGWSLHTLRRGPRVTAPTAPVPRSEEHTSE